MRLGLVGDEMGELSRVEVMEQFVHYVTERSVQPAEFGKSHGHILPP